MRGGGVQMRGRGLGWDGMRGGGGWDKGGGLG